MRRTLLLLTVAMTLAGSAHAQAVRYVVRFPAPQTHYVEVEATYPAAGAQQIEVMMPVWTPGSYLVREYARNVEGESATTDRGESVPLEKTQKNRWRFSTRGSSSMTFRYRVYAREMSVRTNFVDADFALLNGAATYITPVDRLRGPYEVRVELPKEWSRSLTSLTAIEPNHYRATDYDDLVDSPIVAGNPAVHEFAVDGTPHYLVNIGGEEFWDAARATSDVQKIVEQQRRVWGSLPYERYYFFNFIVDTGGGLEHKNSTVIMAHRFAMRTTKAYLDWLDTMSHEHFHAWNVKRLRPVALGPFDYEHENYTSNLWVSEGFTDYYGTLTTAQAGLMTNDEYLKRLSEVIEGVQMRPGRLTQPVALASYDAWIKFYRPDENSVNSTIGYYAKGELVGWILDAKVRRATNGTRTLDDVMRTAYQRYAGPRGFTTEQFLEVVRDVSSAAVASWLQRAVSSTEELDYADALDWFGLEFRSDKPSDDPDKPPRTYLGFRTRNDGGRIMVMEVKSGTPAYDAGVNVDDEILAIDDYRVPPEGLDTRLEQYKAGDEAKLTVARRGRLRTIPVKLAADPKNVWKLHTLEKATPEQTQHFNRWLHPQEKVAEMVH